MLLGFHCWNPVPFFEPQGRLIEIIHCLMIFNEEEKYMSKIKRCPKIVETLFCQALKFIFFIEFFFQHAKTMIHAHDSPLAAIAFSPNGARIATASEKGTVIRVFSVTDSSKLYEFRRGVKRCVAISSLAFSLCGQYLGCSSNTETVHIFKLEDPKDR